MPNPIHSTATTYEHWFTARGEPHPLWLELDEDARQSWEDAARSHREKRTEPWPGALEGMSPPWMHR